MAMIPYISTPPFTDLKALPTYMCLQVIHELKDTRNKMKNQHKERHHDNMNTKKNLALLKRQEYLVNSSS